MSHGYRAVQWSATKRAYDLALGAGVAAVFGTFAAITTALDARVTAETLIIRGSALAAFALLHVVLCIGPLARLDRRFLPLLFNRRHLGVAMFLLALVHAAFATIQFHALGDENPLVSLLTAYQRDYDPSVSPAGSISHFPFEPLGLAALVILFLMAATSHDFWLKVLGASAWKRLHLLVLVAYGLVVLHVAYGALQAERSVAYPIVLGAGAALVFGLHIAAAQREASFDRAHAVAVEGGFVHVARVADMLEGRGKVVVVGDTRLALFRHEGRIYATSNVCRHQGGPLGEGRVVDGCITCPWHGWQYRPHDGQSPPPFDERIATYRTRVVDGAVYVHPEAHPPGTPQEGAPVDGPAVLEQP